MSESVQLAIVGAVCTILGILLTKGVDAIIKLRDSDGAMVMNSKADLRNRILHLEGVVSTLQKEIAGLHRQLGRFEAQVLLLNGGKKLLEDEADFQSGLDDASH